MAQPDRTLSILSAYGRVLGTVAAARLVRTTLCTKNGHRLGTLFRVDVKGKAK